MLVDIQDLSIQFPLQPPVIDHFSMSLGRADRVGLAGESGCGKSTLLRALVGLLPSAAVMKGTARLEGRAGYIPQEGLPSLSPFFTVGVQITDLTDSRQETARLSARVGLGARRFQDAYPHQLSGGERQRVLAIQALATRPAVIIADEPTANLDPDSEAAVLGLMDEYARETGAALLVASHRERVFRALQCSVHRMTPAIPQPEMRDQKNACGRRLVAIDNLSKVYFRRDWMTRSKPVAHALDRVSMEIGEGEAVALVGPSGAGKSTLARCIAGRERWDSGLIEWRADSVPRRERVQLVPQEPSESLNPGMTIAAALREASDAADPVGLEQIRLPREWMGRKASELSEGQRARIAILRSASCLKGGLLILDESLSGLDPGTRSFIISYLFSIRKERGVSVLLVTHDPEAALELGARMVRIESGRITA
jgi:ABC-type glutathione transport system ATPase component